MSMLSDPRQRQHYVLQPKGKPLWLDDSPSFGTKMMEKMGWTKGKGLGRNLSGSQDFIRVTYKQDIKGLGFNEKSDQWTDHEKQFSSFLNSLNSTKDVNLSLNKSEEHNDIINIKSKSLEENSKNSKVRVHYKKFTKAKDISQYSEKDLATIFGKKSLEDSNTIKNDVEKLEENIENLNGLPIITSNANINEYFKRKMSEIQTSRKVQISHFGCEDKNDKSKKRKYSENNDTIAEIANQMINIDSENQNERKKKRKKKNKESNFQETEECLPNEIGNSNIIDETNSMEDDIKFYKVDKGEFDSENSKIMQNNICGKNKIKKKTEKVKSEETLNLERVIIGNKTKKLKNIDANLRFKEKEEHFYEVLEIEEDVVQHNKNSLLKEKKKLKHKKNHNNYLKGNEEEKEEFISDNLKISGNNMGEENKKKKKSKKQVNSEEILNLEGVVIVNKTKKLKNIDADLSSKKDEDNCYGALEILQDIEVQDNKNSLLKEKNKLKHTKHHNNYLKGTEEKEECPFPNETNNSHIVDDAKSKKVVKDFYLDKQKLNICENFKISQNDVYEENRIKKKTKKKKDKSSEDIVNAEKDVAEAKTKQMFKSMEADLTTKNERENCDNLLEINEGNVAECTIIKTKKNKIKREKIKEKEDYKNINKDEGLILNEKESVFNKMKPVEVEQNLGDKVIDMDTDNVKINEKTKDKISTKNITEDKTEHFEESIGNEKELINKKSKTLMNEKEVNKFKNKFYDIKNNRKKIMSVKIDHLDTTTVEEKLECQRNDRFKHIELDTFEITKYCAEKFRLTDLDGFNGANLKKIQGYGLRENFEINVLETSQCTELITKFWNIKMFDSTVNSKYKTERNRENEYRLKVEQARKMKQKIPKRNVKYLKKKSAFTQVLV